MSDRKSPTTEEDQVRLMRLARLDGIRWVLGDVSKHDLEMLAEDQGGERAAPGPNKRLVEMIKRLMRYAHDDLINEEMS